MSFPPQMCDIAKLCRSWRDRLRFTLLLGIGTSPDIFCDRLPRTASKLMRCQSIETVAEKSIVDALLLYTNHDRQARLRIGPSLSEVLLRRQSENLLSVESFIQAVKVNLAVHCQQLGSADTISVRVHESYVWQCVERVFARPRRV